MTHKHFRQQHRRLELRRTEPSMSLTTTISSLPFEPQRRRLHRHCGACQHRLPLLTSQCMKRTSSLVTQKSRWTRNRFAQELEAILEQKKFPFHQSSPSWNKRESSEQRKSIPTLSSLVVVVAFAKLISLNPTNDTRTHFLVIQICFYLTWLIPIRTHRLIEQDCLNYHLMMIFFLINKQNSKWFSNTKPNFCSFFLRSARLIILPSRARM